jgi:MFS family permease
MMTYKKLNNILGWFVFAIAAFTYISTAEPTASFWDCGEYIATAAKLQVGHPPGAPTFQLIGRIFSMFAGGDMSKVAFMVNVMSALVSAFTILFMFWSLTMIIKKLAQRVSTVMTTGVEWGILGSALVGALAYTFTDSFWFSAVEGEVYAMSSFFTALVFWAILKWEQVADQKDSLRWLILIAYLVGLSIGVHLLNLLTVPAIVFVIYFKKFKPTMWGGIKAFFLSILILGFILWGIVPGIVYLFGKFELIFVNGFGLPFNSGTIFFALLIVAGLIWGYRYTVKHDRPVINAMVLAFSFILIGYTTFLILVIRSNANTPIDENNPEDAVSLLSYLNREQYGSTPLFKGPYYNAPPIKSEDGNPVYARDEKAGKYVVIDDKKGTIPVYHPRYTTIFPRMWSDQQPQHGVNYRDWGGIKNDPEGKKIPTFGQNLKYMFNYQLGYMYMRYFMWNFVGRQNDIQGYGDIFNGNWMSGIPFIDEMRLGPQDNIPSSMNSKGKNTYFFLPFILGLLGFIYHFSKDRNNAIIVALLFFMTGLAIAFYLNMAAYQPRERDYAFAASFYAFAMWIGVGAFAVFDFMRKKIEPKTAAIVATLGCTVLVPVLMANQNWDDHNRSNRYTVLAIASNYLNSCAPNAILFTNGDNDTFPLWYAQEVEGVRTDVRVCNLSLFNTDWYMDQMKRKAYDSEPVPMQMTHDQYRSGTREYLFIYEEQDTFVNIKEVVNTFLDESKRLPTNNGKLMNYVSSRKFYIDVDTNLVLKNGTVAPEDASKIVKRIEWEVSNNAIQKNMLGMMDILANFNWKRPIYFATTTGSDAYFGLEDYFQLEGLAYRLVPIRTTATEQNPTASQVNTRILYDNVMNKFKWGNINDPSIYLSEDNTRLSMSFRNTFAKLAHALIDEGKKDSAMKVLAKEQEIFPHKIIPHNYYSIGLAEAYYRINTPASLTKGDEILNNVYNICEPELKYCFRFSKSDLPAADRKIQENLSVLNRLVQVATTFKRTQIEQKSKMTFNDYYQRFMNLKGFSGGEPPM